MFETFKLLNKFYKKEARRGQYLHKIITYCYYAFFEIGSKLIGRNNMKYFLRNITKLAFTKTKIILKDNIIINHPLELYANIIDVIVRDEYSLRNIPTGKVFIDAGANIGLMSLILAKRNKAKRIYAFEPQSENFKLLQKNIVENKFLNISAYKKALYSREGKTKLFLHGSGTHSLFAQRKRQNKHREDRRHEIIEMATVDQYCSKEKDIFMIKIDVEGPELEILKGANKTLQKTQFAIVERSPHTTEGDLLRLLESHGFKIKTDFTINTLYFGSR